jgi:TRAP-type mannitol/chloroaromatic compound transport system permease small subunit|tara:strand:- start:557 stop:1087 length:531 start_codon:yes stop_codon:yes gene_type:complete
MQGKWRMPNVIRTYVRLIDRMSDYVGYVAMYLIFLMVAILLLDAVTRNVIQIPLHWAIEAAQFTLAAYYFMGGAMTLKNNDHVRMDLFYERLSERGKAWMDLATVGCLLFYLVVMLIGSISSLEYAIQTGERRFSMWNPSMIPIKVLIVACIVLMVLQTVSLIFKHVATLRGADLS